MRTDSFERSIIFLSKQRFYGGKHKVGFRIQFIIVESISHSTEPQLKLHLSEAHNFI